MASPALYINRIVVEGNYHLDQSFTRGLNIIQSVQTGDDPRSTNASGKTALVELIQHGLGREHESKARFHLNPILDHLDRLWLEIEANGTILTIERSLTNIFAAAHIREGVYVPGIENTTAELVAIHNMSEYLLDALGIPKVDVKTDRGELTPLSFPLLMRAFVLHQEDSFGGILDKVQPDRRKTDILGFLSEITPLARFTIDSERAEIQNAVEEVEQRYKTIFGYLSERGVPSLERVGVHLASAQKELANAQDSKLQIQEAIRQASETKSYEEPGRLEILRQQLMSVQESITQSERNIVGLQKEEERLVELLASLHQDRKKSDRLLASSTILSTIEFGICPRCLLEITPDMRQREQYARCSLCNRPLRTTSDTPPRAKPRLEDIELQIEETEIILEGVRRELAESRTSLQRHRSLEAELGSVLDKETQSYVSPALDQLLARSQEVTEKEIQVTEARELFKQAQDLETMREQLNELLQKQAEIAAEFERVQQPDLERLNRLRTLYDRILKGVEFPNYRDCRISPDTLLPIINGTYYSNVGTALKGLATVCYHLALLALAREVDTYFPLMLVVDSPAVGDLNDENHDRLLRYFARMQSRAEERGYDLIDWQIILTTRRIVPELEPYVKKKISAPGQMLLSANG